MGDGLSAYQRALDYLFVRTTGQWRFGLERTRAILDALGNPHERLRVIHVAGTNGKGSVCATLERVLLDRGFRVAKYTSPHLVDFRERILIDGVPVSEDEIVDFIHEWTPTIERVGATFFEATTAMAFAMFARAKPDIAIVEVGLGGRLDSTNVVDPIASIVTSIGIDHTDYLGPTTDDIAREKAGIFKPGRLAIIGERDERIRALLRGHAQTAGAEPINIVCESVAIEKVRVTGAGTSFEMSDVGRGTIAARPDPRPTTPELQFSLIGAHQAWNAALSLRALELLPAPFATPLSQSGPSLSRVVLAGRFQRWGKWIFDVAHNPDGMHVCAATLAAVDPPRPRVVVLSILRDKDWEGMIEALIPHVDHLILTVAPTSPSERAWVPETALTFAKETGVSATVERNFATALDIAAKMGQTVLVTGSFHTVGDAMMRLHVSPLAG